MAVWLCLHSLDSLHSMLPQVSSSGLDRCKTLAFPFSACHSLLLYSCILLMLQFLSHVRLHLRCHCWL